MTTIGETIGAMTATATIAGRVIGPSIPGELPSAAVDQTAMGAIRDAHHAGPSVTSSLNAGRGRLKARRAVQSDDSKTRNKRR